MSMKYYAYGSNMLLARISKRVPSAKALSIGALVGHKLMWHKVSSDRSGKCDAYQTNNKNDILYGVIFDISEDEKHILDAAEGLGYGFDEKIVSVYSENDEVHIDAVTYYATNLNPDLQPYHWYKSFVLEGAVENNLPEHHIAVIRNIESIDDPDTKRTKLNENILDTSTTFFGEIKGGVNKVATLVKQGVEKAQDVLEQSSENVGSTAEQTFNKTKKTISNSKIYSFAQEQLSTASDISDDLITYIKEKSSKLSSSVSLTILSAPELLKITEAITKSSASIYDKAMDMEYLKTHIGGGNHRIFDGGHTISGAWEKVASASTDDSFSQEVIGYVSGMWKDVTTTKGIPFFTIDTESYSQYSNWVKDNIPLADKEWAYDLLNYDALEVLSVCITSASLLFAFKDNDIEKLSEILGRMSIISVASANPLMMISMIFFTAYSYFLHKNKVKAGKFFSGAGTSVVSTATFALLTVLGAGFIVKIGVTIVATSLIKKNVIENDSILILIKEHKPDMSLMKPEIIKWFQRKSSEQGA